MTEPTDALMPCPFCGGDARHDAHADDCYFILHRKLQNSGADMSMHLEVLAAWNRRVAPAAMIGEPVFAFRRKGLDDFCTCTEERYAELSTKPNLFETRIFYTTPQPTQAQAGAVPLTDEQLAEIMRETWGCASIAPRHAIGFARAIERAHGIGIKGGLHGAK